MHRVRIAAITVFSALLLPFGAAASQMTWAASGGSGNTWDIGEFTNSYLVDGVTVTITVTDNGPVSLIPGIDPKGSPGSLSSNSFLDPTGNAGGSNLFFKTRGNNDGINILIEFDAVVENISISMFDVDATNSSGHGSYIDLISGQSSLDQILWLDPDNVTGSASATWIWDGNSTVTGTDNADETGGNSADGTVNWEFTAPLSSINFDFSNANSAFVTQWIGLSHINFTEGPEPGTAFLLGLGLFGLGLQGRQRRKRVR